MTCNDAYDSIVRTIDDARLTVEERTALRRHLASCARCRGEYETQHEVRRLLVLHIQDQLPAGFDARLSARLAQTPRLLPGGPVRATPPAGMPGRTWALRLIPLAATLALIAGGTFVRDSGSAPSSGVKSGAAADTPASSTSPDQPRAFTTVAVRRNDGASPRRDPSSSASTHDVAPSSSPSPSSPVDDAHTHGLGAVADSGIAIETVLGAMKVVPGAPELNSRVPVPERREPGVNGDNGELAVSQRPGILPRPPTPFPLARPAMPAPPAMPADRSIPPP